MDIWGYFCQYINKTIITNSQQLRIQYMGNKGSQFQTQFYKRYSFIQVVDDKLFGTAKIYRKNTVKFDYIMILQIKLEDLSQNQIQILEQRLKQIRSYQNETTLRVYHYKFLQPVKIECRNKRLIIYAQYMNRSIFDYLCALRTNPSQIVYVLKNVAKSCISLKSNFQPIKEWESQSLIYPRLKYSCLQKARLFFAHCFMCCNHLKGLLPTTKYQKYSITCLHQIPNQSNFALRQQFLNILLEMTGNLNVRKLHETNFLYQLIQQSPNLQTFYSQLPQIETETMRIEQMHRMENMNGQFYDLT